MIIAHLDALHALAREDAAVHAFIRMAYRDDLEWTDVLSQMVLHLAKEKAALTARLIDAEHNRAPAGWAVDHG